MKKETKVNCEVESCKHNEEKKCSLEELDISCTCDGEDCEEIEETIKVLGEILPMLRRYRAK